MKLQIEQEIRLSGTILFNIIRDNEFITCAGSLDEAKQIIENIKSDIIKKEIIYTEEI